MNLFVSLCRRGQLQLGAVVVLGGAWACGGSNSLSPSAEAPLASDTTLAGAPADSTIIAAGDSLLPPGDSTSGQDTVGIATAAAGPGPGIVFAMMGMQGLKLAAPFNGSKYGVMPGYVMKELDLARAKGARMVLELASGPDDNIQNPDGTFSFTRWKAMVDAFRRFNFGPYIADGTLMGHFLIDEPQHAPKWGGKVIPQATVEAMAQYSKSIWPNLPTFARVAPTWLSQAPFPYVHLDAGWAQYVTRRGEVTRWITAEVAAARKKGLGIAVGLNILNGGNGSSGLRGTVAREWKMSAAEIRNYGTALLNQAYACGFFSWSYLEGGALYLARSDIKSAMTDLSRKAATHIRTSCRQ